MKFAPGALLAMTLLLAACRVVAPPVTTQQEPLTRPVDKASPRASASPEAAVLASASPSASPGASPSTAPALLQKPAGATRLLSGLVTIDAYYGVTQGGGRLISNNGSSVLTFGGASVVGNNGGNIISDNGASLVSKVKAPIPGLVSKVKDYRVLQAADTPPLGEVLPAAGMAIRAFSLRTGDILSLGVNPAGQPVYEVYSDAAGKYQIYLPESEVNNVLLQAFVPEKADQRLDYSIVVAKTESTPAFDEDTALMTDFLRQAFTDSMEADLATYVKAATIGEAVAAGADKYNATYREILMTMRRKLFTAAEKAGVKGYDAARRHVLAQRVTDAAFSHMDLAAIQTDYAGENITRPEEPALPALTRIMREGRERVRTSMRELAAAGKSVEAEYGSSHIVKRVNEYVEPDFVIKTPADAMTFYVRGLVNNPHMPVEETRRLLRELQDDPQYKSPPGSLDEMYACTKQLQKVYVQTFYVDPVAGQDVLAVIEAGVPAP